MKSSILFFLLVVVNLTSCSQERTCKSLHVRKFKTTSKEFGTTIITRTKNLQVEENKDLGYKLTYEITWINDCSYELRLKKVIQGDPALINDSKYVITVRIKEIKKNSYLAENSSTYSDKITIHEFAIMH